MSEQTVSNPRVRAALEAFDENRSAQTMMRVLRECLSGELLLDITGTPEAPGGGAQVRGGTGPDGEPALVAFTSAEELMRMHPAGTHVRWVAQPAGAVLDMAKRQSAGWVFIDPAGPTVGFSALDVEQALRYPRNSALRRAVLDGDADAVRTALRAQGALHLAGTRKEGSDDETELRVTERGDDRILHVHSAAPEIWAARLEDGVVAGTTASVRDLLGQTQSITHVLVDPAGPSMELTRADLLG